MTSNRQMRVEQRAYEIWEAEGYPHGKHEDHWHRAACEIDAEETARAGKSRIPRANGQIAPNSRSPSPQRKRTRTA
jgi:hypothetical protein